MLVSRLKAPRKVFLRHPSSLFLWSIFNKVRPYTCVSYDALLQMKRLIEDLDRRGIKGDIVEAGCWRGGCAAFMAWHCKNVGNGRRVFMLDSFEEDYSWASGTAYTARDRDTYALAKEIVSLLGVKDNAVIIKGFVHDSIPIVKDSTTEIALLRLDLNGSVSGPTRETLDQLYGSISSGGVVVSDNFEMQGERDDIRAFRESNGVVSPIIKPRFWEKEYWVKK